MCPSPTPQIYVTLHFCPWYFYKKLETEGEKNPFDNEKNPRSSANYYSTGQKALGEWLPTTH